MEFNNDICKMINTVLDRNDSSVHITITRDNISVTAMPISETPHWIVKEPSKEKIHYLNTSYICSECGASYDYPFMHCPDCGELLKKPNDNT